GLVITFGQALSRWQPHVTPVDQLRPFPTFDRRVRMPSLFSDSREHQLRSNQHPILQERRFRRCQSRILDKSGSSPKLLTTNGPITKSQNVSFKNIKS